MFTFNHHVLNHIPHLIEQLGCLRAFSARSLERKIGSVKRAVRSNKAAGVNSNNQLEQGEIFDFLAVSNTIDFDLPYMAKSVQGETFRYHPSYIPGHLDFESNKNRPQQWSPFIKGFQLLDLAGRPEMIINKIGITAKEFEGAMLNYYRRLQGSRTSTFEDHHYYQDIQLSQRLWCDSLVYSCASYKENRSNSTRKDQYCMFTSTHKTK